VAHTKCICHKGCGEYSGIVARTNSCADGQRTTPNPLRHIHSTVISDWEESATNWYFAIIIAQPNCKNYSFEMLHFKSETINF